MESKKRDIRKYSFSRLSSSTYELSLTFVTQKRSSGRGNES